MLHATHRNQCREMLNVEHRPHAQAVLLIRWDKAAQRPTLPAAPCVEASNDLTVAWSARMRVGCMSMGKSVETLVSLQFKTRIYTVRNTGRFCAHKTVALPSQIVKS